MNYCALTVAVVGYVCVSGLSAAALVWITIMLQRKFGALFAGFVTGLLSPVIAIPIFFGVLVPIFNQLTLAGMCQ